MHPHRRKAKEDSCKSSVMTRSQQRGEDCFWYASSRLSFQVRVSMDDKTLCQLIQQVINSNDGTSEQRQALERLLKCIPKLPGIYKENNPRLDYNNAFNQALMNLAGMSLKTGKGMSGKNIRSFAEKTNLNSPPETVRQNLVNWFNKILKRRIYDFYRQLPNEPFSLDVSFGEDDSDTHLDNVKSLTLSGIDELISEEELKENQKQEEELKQRFEELAQEMKDFPNGCPNCTCYELIQRRELRRPKQKWKDIADELNVPQGTVTAHWHRKCKPILKRLPTLK
ncbi:MAG: hypothetical protein ACOC04_06630 [Halothece sp.]